MEGEKLYASAKRLIIIAALLVFIAAAFTAAEWIILFRESDLELYDALFLIGLALQFIVVPFAMVLAIIGIVRAAKANARGEKTGRRLVVLGAITAGAAESVWVWFFIVRTLIGGMSV